MVRRKIIAGNWKMHMTSAETLLFFNEFVTQLPKDNNNLIYIAPPFTSLFALHHNMNLSNIAIGAQNMHDEEQGAFTGEISAKMLLDVGVRFVILGHSERRHVFKETDEFIHKKILTALKHRLEIILCIGETEEQRENNQMQEILSFQLQEGLKKLSAEQLSRVTIAYEPVWAIGTGKTATPEIAQNAHQFIREKIKTMFSQMITEEMSILYGGSVKPENIHSLIKQPDIDGVLVGGASLKPTSFLGIINNAKE